MGTNIFPDGFPTPAGFVKVAELSPSTLMSLSRGMPFTAKGIAERMATGPIIPTGPKADVDETEYYLSCARNVVLAAIEKMFRVFQKGMRAPAVRPYWGKSKQRARLVGYHFQVLIRNCHGNKFELAEEIMAKCGAFDIDKELMRDKWLIPMSGSLHNDLRANFVAKYIQQASPDEGFDLLEAIDEIIIDQLAECFESNLKKWAVLPVMPMGIDDDECIRYINQFVDYDRPEKSRYDKEIGDGAVFTLTGLAANDSGWYSLFVDRQSFCCGNGQFRAVPCLSLIDSRISDPNKGFGGLKSTEMFDEVMADELRENLNTLKSVSPGDLDREDLSFLSSAAMLTQLFERERLHLQQERARMSKNKKTAAELERANKTIVELQAKCATLQSKLNAQPKAEKSAKQALYDRDQKIKQLENYIKKLKADAADAQCREEEATERAEEAVKAQAALEDEITALQGQLEALPVDDADTGEEEKLDTSVFNDKRIVIVGGHPTWLRGMKGLHPSIEFYGGKESPVSNEAIQSADAVWLQTNCIGHPTFYRVVSCAKVYNKPIKYFAYAGHRACRQQIVNESKEIFHGQVGA